MSISIAPVVPVTRDVDDITDHELVARIRAGDDRAFECLYRRYHRRIASYVQGMVHDHARSEDITQDVFMSALRRMRSTDRPIAFKPWIYEIAKNACIDQFRRSRRAEEVSYDADEGLGSADYGRLVNKDPEPDARFETKQQLDHLRGAFGGLSETHHQILVMRELEGLSYREIGERMGMTRPAVESTLFRARRRLTEEYEELVTGERCQRVQAIIAATGSAALGARDRRRVARHVSYCQPCLRHARVSGMDAGDLVVKPVRAKIAALLPLPAFLKKRLGSEESAVPDLSPSLTTWSAQLSALDPSVVSGWGKAMATAATIALAGVGAGVATNPPSSVRAALGTASPADRTGGGAAERTLAARDAAPSAPRPAATPAAGTSSTPARESAAPRPSTARRQTPAGASAPDAATPAAAPAAGGTAVGDAAPKAGEAEPSGALAGAAPEPPEVGVPAIVLPAPAAPVPSGAAQETAPGPSAPGGDGVGSAGSSAPEGDGKTGIDAGGALEGILGGQ